MFSFFKRCKMVNDNQKIGKRVCALSECLGCEVSVFSEAAKNAMVAHGSLKGVVERSKNESEMWGGILDWVESHLGLVKAQL